jgi:hypothetical protein
MSAFAEPAPCPYCWEMSPRALSAATVMGGGDAGAAPRPAMNAGASHRSGCACCGPPARGSAFQAAPGKRPAAAPRSKPKATSFLNRN